MSRNVWPTLAVLFGLLAAASIGYIVGQLAPLTAPQTVRVPPSTGGFRLDSHNACRP